MQIKCFNSMCGILLLTLNNTPTTARASGLPDAKASFIELKMKKKTLFGE